jgi:hypothetical protein
MRPAMFGTTLLALAMGATAAYAQTTADSAASAPQAVQTAAPTPSEFQPHVEVHGFGSWHFGASNANHYLGATSRGSSNQSQFAVNVSGRLTERLSFASQVQYEWSTGATTANLDYAFAEWKVSDALRLRAGQVKHPWGNYGEIQRVGTVRPFTELPQSIYAKVGMVAEAYRGIGITGSLQHHSGWSVEYDVYTGGLNREEYEAPLDLYRIINGTKDTSRLRIDSDAELTDRLFGARITLVSLSGFRIGGSWYDGSTYENNQTSTITSWGAHSEFARGGLTMRGEYERQYEEDGDWQRGWYVEGSHRFLGGWEVAGQYNKVDVGLEGATVPEAASLLHHKEWAVGLNYHFTPGFVIKSSYHDVTGNRISIPEPDEILPRLQAGIPLDRKTRAFIFGAQFSF